MNRKNTVDYQELLKRYYEGKTTLEEENLLRTHLFSHTEESHADVTLFRILAEESQALPPDGMEQRLEAWIDRQPAVPSRKRLFLFWGPLRWQPPCFATWASHMPRNSITDSRPKKPSLPKKHWEVRSNVSKRANKASCALTKD